MQIVTNADIVDLAELSVEFIIEAVCSVLIDLQIFHCLISFILVVKHVDCVLRAEADVLANFH